MASVQKEKEETSLFVKKLVASLCLSTQLPCPENLHSFVLQGPVRPPNPVGLGSGSAVH